MPEHKEQRGVGIPMCRVLQYSPMGAGPGVVMMCLYFIVFAFFFSSLPSLPDVYFKHHTLRAYKED